MMVAVSGSGGHAWRAHSRRRTAGAALRRGRAPRPRQVRRAGLRRRLVRLACQLRGRGSRTRWGTLRRQGRGTLGRQGRGRAPMSSWRRSCGSWTAAQVLHTSNTSNNCNSRNTCRLQRGRLAGRRQAGEACTRHHQCSRRLRQQTPPHLRPAPVSRTAWSLRPPQARQTRWRRTGSALRAPQAAPTPLRAHPGAAAVWQRRRQRRGGGARLLPPRLGRSASGQARAAKGARAQVRSGT